MDDRGNSRAIDRVRTDKAKKLHIILDAEKNKKTIEIKASKQNMNNSTRSVQKQKKYRT